MNSQVKAMGDEAIRRGRDSWLPVIRPERRSVLERIHAQVAAEWSRALSGHLRQDGQIQFDGLGFETFGANSEADIGNSLAAVFVIDGTTVGGLLRISAELAAWLAETQFGLTASSGQASRSTPFTRLEMALLQEQMRVLLERLGAAYDAAGIGHLAVARSGQRLKHMLRFTPDSHLAVFRFRIGDAPSPYTITIAAHPDLINLVPEPAALAYGDAAGSPRIAAAAAEVPVEVDVVLGTWSVPLEDLTRLKPGESFILPGGEDAWLEAGAVKLKRVQVKLGTRGGVIETLGSMDHDGKS